MQIKKHLYIILWYLLLANTTFAYSHSDSLRGSNGDGRYWWNVTRYDLSITFDTARKSIIGQNIISFDVIDTPKDMMQIDLQEPMIIDSILNDGNEISFSREKNVSWLDIKSKNWQKGTHKKLTIYYHGIPVEAKLPPWEGGFIWKEDSNHKLWLSVACQGFGASSWWPCKDYQAEEPDSGMTTTLTVPGDLVAISNGKLIAKKDQNIKNEPYTAWTWEVKNPINSYNVTFYIGDYVSWQDTLMGEKGELPVSYYVLRENELKAKKHFSVVKEMLHCFEYWMGPYPFYEDGYKLVEAPHLGMEHQSAVAYGNEYKMGYRGMDRSSTGVGLKFDFIIVHESGHEWFGNNITAKDIADNWIHEGFTTYTETLFAECMLGKENAYKYVRGEWQNIRNDKPVIGKYGIQNSGSSDEYDKGAAVVHMIRVMMNDDERFRNMLRAMNKEFYHTTVTSKDIEHFIEEYSGLELSSFFDQYLRTRNIPTLEWYIKNKKLNYRFFNTTKGFTLPITVKTRKKEKKILVTNEWQSINWKKGGYNVKFSKDFLIHPKP